MLRNKFLIVISVLALSACGTTAPVIKTEIQKVEIPIATVCKVAIPAKPVLSFPKLNESDDIFVKAKALLADRILQLDYENRLAIALDSCTK